MLFMEKTMEQIYRKQFPHGSYSVYGEYINGDLILSDHYGILTLSSSGVTDEYEYYSLSIKNVQNSFRNLTKDSILKRSLPFMT